MTKNLTAKRSKFIDEYMINSNATQAAIKAGYSKKTAYSIGQRLLKNVEVKRELGKRHKAQSEATQTSAEWAINELRINHELARGKGDIGHSNRALEIIRKHHADKERIEETIDTVVTVTIIKPDRSLETL